MIKKYCLDSMELASIISTHSGKQHLLGDISSTLLSGAHEQKERATVNRALVPTVYN